MDARKAYWMSSLSESTYFDLQDGKDAFGIYEDGLVQRVLTGKGFTADRAFHLTEEWKLVHHLPNTDSGFSATVFESKREPGAFVVAMRGTEGPPFTISGGIDWSTNLGDIGADGIALAQGIDLFNYYQRLVTPSGTNAPQYAVFDGLVISTVYQQGEVPGLGILAEGVRSVDVTGHSLGGHLALMLSRMDPAGIRDVYTFSAPGFGTGLVPALNQVEWFYGALRHAQTEARGSSTVGGFPLDRIYNFAAPQDPVARIGTVPGPVLGIASEVNEATPLHRVLSAHSIGNIADALAVYELFGQLDEGVSAATVGRILAASAVSSDDTLESAIGYLGHVTGQGVQFAWHDREALHQAISAMRSIAEQPGTLLLEPLDGLKAEVLRDRAYGEAAYRYALVNLMPFAAVGADPRHADRPALDRFDPVTREGSLSDAYLIDRAFMLERMLARNLIDGSSKGPERHEFRDTEQGIVFHVDSTNAVPAVQYVFGGTGRDHLRGLSMDDHLYAGDGSDVLEPGPGQDYLEGGRGFDTYLLGTEPGMDTILDIDGSGVIVIGDVEVRGFLDVPEDQWTVLPDGHFFDQLNGIRYALSSAGTHADLVVMTDEAGVRVQNWREGDLGIALESASEQEENAGHIEGTQAADYLRSTEPGAVSISGGDGRDLLWGSSLDDRLSGGEGADWIIGGGGIDQIDAGAGDDLVTWIGGGSVVGAGPGDDIVNGYAREWLSIVEPHPAVPASAFWADLAAHWRNDRSGMTERDGIMTAYAGGGVLGNAELVGKSILGGDWTYRFTFSGDDGVEARYFHPLHFPDGIAAADSWGHTIRQAPEDGEPLTILGGDGSDWLAGNAGADRLDGGPGDDLVLGNEGDDRLFGVDGDDDLAGGDGNDWLFGGPDDDRLWGEAGDDLLEGGTGSDQLWGGAGLDRLHGGEGNDLVLGGGGADFLFGNEGEDVLYGDGHAGAMSDSGEAGDDHLDGGSGDDLVLGGPGDDVLLGGEGDDRLLGEAGADVLVGGAGSDHLTGGEGADTFVMLAGGGADLALDATDEDLVLLPDTLLASVTTQLVRSLDGDDYLQVQWTEDDALFVRSGMTSGPARYELANGTVLNRGELIAATMSHDLRYGLAAPGTLHAGAGSDVLTGSDGDDALFGNAGEDLLAGGLGADRLAGGEGVDRYQLGPGTGQDIVDEAFGETSVLQLLPGLSIDDLQFLYRGDDLWVGSPLGQDGVSIIGFATRAQLWSVEDALGRSLTISPEILARDSQRTVAGSLETMKADFVKDVETAYANLLRVSGYRQDDQGGWQREKSQAGGIRRDSAGTQRVEVEPGADHHVRSLPAVQVSLAGESTQARSVPVTTYPADSVFVAALPGLATVDFDELERRGISGIRVDGRLVPVRGTEWSYNPLTGESETTIEGYRLLPWNAPEPRTELVEQQVSYRDHAAVLTILDVRLGEGDSRFENQAWQEHAFSIVDGGAGDDVLDARVGIGGDVRFDHYQYAQPAALVSGAFRDISLVDLPGNLLWGGAGEDQLFGGSGADLLVGGAGDDYMQGGLGADTYVVQERNGLDLVFEDGWQARPGPPDTLILPDSVTLEGLSYEWHQRLHPSLDPAGSWKSRVESVHSSLVLRWGEGEGVEVLLPHSDQRAGLGLEQVRFGDGASISFPELVAAAGGAADADPHARDNTIVSARFARGGPGDDRLSAAPPSPGGDGLGATDLGYDAILIGDAGQDHLVGGIGADLLLGGSIVEDSSLDFLRPVAGLWDAGNLFRGGAGDDTLWGTAGADVFLFGPGDGADRVTDLLHDPSFLFARDWHGVGLGDPRLNSMLSSHDDPAALVPEHWDQLHASVDVLRFDPGIAPWEIRVEALGDDLVFAHANGTDRVVFDNWFAADVNQLARVEFANGSHWDRDDFLGRVGRPDANRPPAVAVLLPPTVFADEDTEFSFVLPENAFVDPDGDELYLSAGLVTGDPLPDWLAFDTAALSLGGRPGQADLGAEMLRFTAQDPSGEVVWQDLTLDVRNVNDAPYVTRYIGTQTATVDQPWRLDLPHDAFGDEDVDDSLRYRLDRADGGALPAWLQFDAGNARAEGTPPLHAVGGLDLRLAALDRAGAEASQVFTLDVVHGLEELHGDDRANRLRATPDGSVLFGHAGNDRLFGRRGDDVLAGGEGDDLLAGGRGNDTYLFHRGDGRDRILENASRGDRNQLVFGPDVSFDQIWFGRRGSGLEISLIGTGDQVTIPRWFKSRHAAIDSVHVAEGRVLSAASVGALVDAMAAFAPPSMGQTSLPAGYRDALEPVLAASWQ